MATDCATSVFFCARLAQNSSFSSLLLLSRFYHARTASVVSAFKNKNTGLTPVTMEIVAYEGLKDDLVREMVEDALIWTSLHGLVVGDKNDKRSGEVPGVGLVHAPFSLLPMPFPRTHFIQACELSTIFNDLVDRVSLDGEFLQESLSRTKKVDPFTSRLLDIHHKMMESDKEDIRLGLHRSDYMLDGATNLLYQIELNTIASSFSGLSCIVGELHRNLINHHGKNLGLDSKKIPLNPSVSRYAEALAKAWNEYNDPSSVVLVVVQSLERNMYDQHWLCSALKEKHNVRTIRKTLAEIEFEGEVLPDGTLQVCGKNVSVVYFRAGYSPDDYPTEAEWKARYLVEQSSAVKCPSISYHLVGTKKIQQELAKPNVLERFVENKYAIEKLRKSFAGLWSLDNMDIVRDAMERPEFYVLKPQREGGGNNIYNDDVRDTLMRLQNERSEELSAVPSLKLQLLLSLHRHPFCFSSSSAVLCFTSRSIPLPSISHLSRNRLVFRTRVSCVVPPRSAADAGSATNFVASNLASEAFQEATSSQGYDSNQIQVLEGLDPVRKRPGMYIGSTGSRGLHHLVYEILDNAIDEAQAGYATKIDVLILADNSVCVTDNGRGIPVDLHPVTKKSALETVLTILHAGGKFGGLSSGYSVSGGLHGVGLSVVNALSEALEVTVWRDGNEYRQTYSRGKPLTPLTSHVLPIEQKSRQGTSIRFWPDKDVFTTTIDFDYNTISGRIRELAFLNPKLTITLQRVDGESLKSQRTEYCYAGGLVEYVRWLNTNKKSIHDILSLKSEMGGVSVDVALQWSEDAYADTMLGYANSIRTIDGGTHMDGLKASLTRTINNLGKKSKVMKENNLSLSGEHVREGLTCVISVKVPNPEFEGQTKTRLGNPEVRKVVDQCVQEQLTEYLELHPDVLDLILSKALNALKAAMAAKRARELVRTKSILKSSSLPGKLADCSNTNPEESEIFIVEGDSAGGSTKQGRDRRFQAVLPLRGKILNIERKDEAAMYKNEEIQNLILGLGLGVKGEDFRKEALRYHKIIILTDADVDGAHIRTLLLTFFFRYQKALFDEGCIYVGVPPLYKLERGKQAHYCYDEKS